ncbi:hypothetical protein DAKH74_001350 [Maudiozyma humilis]|uniref:BAR domain-containing protein n=1 Tax=Maudiozyma humilis TaxID=51915 RepID=A0AAV5RPM9_MAUHU|nr:hypothetical protein DAKH74_001350 [Kazachstania humilis]
MFSNFSLDKLTTTLTSAAAQVEESLKANALLPTEGPSALSFQKASRMLQERVGVVAPEDISKLPESYTALERRSDALVRVLRRLLLVTKTYEIEGYDYPPNLSESLNDWWTQQPADAQSEEKKKKVQFSKSFAAAIAKSAYESEEHLKALRAPVNGKAAAAAAEATAEDETEEPADEAEEEEEDEDLAHLIEVFGAWSKVFQDIDASKVQLDSVMIKEFNARAEKMVDGDYKEVTKLRAKVEDSRLEFDTVRHDVKVKEARAQAEKKDEKPKSEEKTETKTEEKDEKTAEAKDEKTTEAKDEKKDVDAETESEDYKLLEKLEDEFVSNTTAAAERMMEFASNSEVIQLVKLFQQAQLDYYKKCTAELEKNMAFLNTFDVEDNE